MIDRQREEPPRDTGADDYHLVGFFSIGLGEIEGGQANNPEHRRVDLRIFMQPGGDISSRGSSTMGLVVAGR